MGATISELRRARQSAIRFVLLSLNLNKWLRNNGEFVLTYFLGKKFLRRKDV